jgi:hypothetical protein
MRYREARAQRKRKPSNLSLLTNNLGGRAFITLKSSSSSSAESPSSSAWTTSTSTSASASASETHCLITIVFLIFFDTLGVDAITQERVVSRSSTPSRVIGIQTKILVTFYRKSMIRIGPSSVVGSWNNNAHNLMRLMTQPLISETGSDSIHSSYSFRFLDNETPTWPHLSPRIHIIVAKSYHFFGTIEKQQAIYENGKVKTRSAKRRTIEKVETKATSTSCKMSGRFSHI